MDRRLILQEKLENILGTRNVYFQPPSNTHIKYPCIVYTRDDFLTRNADDVKYMSMGRYSITLIGHSPENELIPKLCELDYCSYDRHFVSDGLHHDAFTLYF